MLDTHTQKKERTQSFQFISSTFPMIKWAELIQPSTNKDENMWIHAALHMNITLLFSTSSLHRRMFAAVAISILFTWIKLVEFFVVCWLSFFSHLISMQESSSNFPVSTVAAAVFFEFHSSAVANIQFHWNIHVQRTQAREIKSSDLPALITIERWVSFDNQIRNYLNLAASRYNASSAKTNQNLYWIAISLLPTPIHRIRSSVHQITRISFVFFLSLSLSPSIPFSCVFHCVAP